MKRLCVCEICNCGRHRCPHQPTVLYRKGSEGYAVTEYVEKFPAYESRQPPKILKPKYEYTADRGKMEGTTTFKSDFIPYEVSRRPGKQQAEYQPNPGEIDLGTTYKQDFNPYQLQPVTPLKPKVMIRPTSGKLNAVPTYKEDFRAWEIPKRELSKPDETYHPPPGKFGNTTTFQDDFVPRGPVLRESFKPLNVAKQNDAPFEGVTSNQLSYIPHPVEARFIKAPEEYKPSSQPFQDLTTHRKDYQGISGPMPKSFKPERVKISSEAPFQSSTEFRERFQQWPVSLPQVHKSVEYVSPTADMDLTTTTKTTYIKHKVQPFISIKPFPKPNRSPAPFHSNTTMKDDFKPWVTARRLSTFHKPEEIQRASGKMEDLTTFRAHFIQHPLQPNISYKPAAAPPRTDVPLEESTSYRTDFTPKKVSVCPASFESPPGFIFQNSDERGHRFFRRVSDQDKIQVQLQVQAPNAVAVMS
ncbi:stabilizer of axonemal microtubules 2 isoform X1 [Astyanax mexicanus]|uniref:Stabilizer of axonemal microtubules 1 n=2 Tax=Astyanax mexicanus TaxID=7994 RepID=A0A8B9RAC8_ASTMX|nr:stabilizer of axonemal microtubules 2 isoform X1 [Astyanax mexicanus]